MNPFELNDIYKKNVGEFILTFSEIEFSLGIMISYIEYGINNNPINTEIIGLSLDEKKKRIRRGLENNIDLLKKWNKIDGTLSDCNEFRRLIAHGIVLNHLPNPSLQAIVRAKPRNGLNGFIYREITNEEIYQKLKKLIDINSGKLGIGALTSEIKNWKK